MKVIIIDDEEQSRNAISKMLIEIYGNEVKIIGQANNVKTGVDLIENNEVDVIYLDIKMPDGTGFDLLERLTKINFEIIFITAFNEFAIRAFEMSAIGYLLKPINFESFLKASNKAKKFISKEKNNIKVLIENIKNGSVYKIAIPNNDGLYVTNLDEILYLEGDINYTHIFLVNEKKITSSKTIRAYEEILDKSGFFRIHKSFIVNLKYVIEYKKSINSVILSNLKELPLSRLRKQEFQNIF